MTRARWALPLALWAGGCGPDGPGPKDDDRDGVLAADDCDDNDSRVGAPWTVWLDHDGDGYGAEGASQLACGEVEGWTTQPGDCHDADPAVHPGAAEVCNGLDDDCDGALDGGDASLEGAATVWADGDGDGWGAGAATTGCPGDGWTDSGDGDCDDGDAAVSPDAAEICGNGIDDDCSGDAPECSPAASVSAADATATWWGEAGGGLGGRAVATGDLDGDGLADAVVPAISAGAGGEVAWVSGAVALADRTLPDGAGWGASAPLARLGSGAAADGDADGDGVMDLALGADAEGAVRVVFGGPDMGAGWGAADGAPVAVWGPPGERFGAAARWVGDVEGDGRDDLLVVADLGAGGAGEAWLFSGGGLADGDWSAEEVALATFTGEDTNDHFGGDTAGSVGGDLDGDGLSDVILGVPGQDAGDADAGGVAVFAGQEAMAGARGAADASLRIIGPFASGDSAFGASVAVGDLDGDGGLDLVVGAPAAEGAATNSGAAFVFSGGATLFDADLVADDALLTLLGEASGDRFGAAVATSDLGAGAAVVVGAPGHDAVERDAGQATVFPGAATPQTWSAEDAAHRIEGDVARGALGATVSAAAFDGGGRTTLLLGAPGADALYLLRVGGL